MLLLWKTIWRLLKILLLNIYPKKTKALVQKGTSTETESRLMVAWAGEGGTGWGVTVSGCRVCLWADENVQALVMMIAQPCKNTKNHQTVHFKGI